MKKYYFDIVVIGGGPAGMIAAGRAAELGAKVVLIEKNQSLGKKLLITGGGRCNISQAEFKDKIFANKLGKNGQFLLSALSIFGPKEIIEFFEKKGLKTKIERGKRIFPVSDKASDVLNVLLRYLDRNKVEIFSGQGVDSFNIKDKKIKSVKLKDKEIFARSYILATGGKSYSRTGSDGKGYKWAKKMGHKIIDLKPVLTPIKIKEDWPIDLQGLSLKNVSVSVFQNNKKQDSRFGEMLFTHFGISGPIIIDLSKKIGELLNTGEVILKIDLKPALDVEILDKRLQRDFKSNKDFKNYLPDLVPKRIGDLVLRLTDIDKNKKINLITKDERKKIIETLKCLTLTVKNLVGFSSAIVTSGGVDLKEIDSKIMKSKIIENLYLAGEIIDLDGPTGGYNLQICWTTGYVAGQSASLIKLTK
ncbi:MAG: NAD(P)/FAD-dependent oxidoreductase [Candidatus Portnoybacteria bacterium]|nr:NAD(P)/FAD-dependent oxidoreductase [Candidatus Portnoybacteria bacterium]